MKTEDLPTGFIVEGDFFYLLASRFFLCCNSPVGLGEQSDVVGHEMKWSAESSRRIFPIGEGLICINGVSADRGEISLERACTMESYKTFGGTGYKDTHHVSSIALSHFSKSLPNLTSTP